MFRKTHGKRRFPPGTFIPTGARVLAILHLCIAFSVICYTLGTPFLEEVFQVRELQALYRSIGEDPHFHSLSSSERENFTGRYEQLLAHGSRSFDRKMAEAASLLLLGLPPFKMAWLILSIAVPLLLLKKVEGARTALWLIPLVTVFYCLDNLLFLPEKPPLQELQLFPTEKYLTEKYCKIPLSPEIAKQREELSEAWSRYLAKEWAEESPSGDPALYMQQAAKGRFAFNRARLEAKERDRSLLTHKEWRLPSFQLALFLIWNFFFSIAFFMQDRRCRAGTKKPMLQSALE